MRQEVYVPATCSNIFTVYKIYFIGRQASCIFAINRAFMFNIYGFYILFCFGSCRTDKLFIFCMNLTSLRFYHSTMREFSSNWRLNNDKFEINMKQHHTSSAQQPWCMWNRCLKLLLQWPAAVFDSCSVLKKEVKRRALWDNRYEHTHTHTQHKSRPNGWRAAWIMH